MSVSLSMNALSLFWWSPTEYELNCRQTVYKFYKFLVLSFERAINHRVLKLLHVLWCPTQVMQYTYIRCLQLKRNVFHLCGFHDSSENFQLFTENLDLWNRIQLLKTLYNPKSNVEFLIYFKVFQALWRHFPNLYISLILRSNSKACLFLRFLHNINDWKKKTGENLGNILLRNEDSKGLNGVSAPASQICIRQENSQVCYWTCSRFLNIIVL